MRISRSLFLALSLLALPVAASAEGPATEAPKAAVAVQPAVAPEATRAPEMKLKEIKLQDRQQDKAVAADPMARGSFWWLVGVVVVAGVILAVLL